MHRVDTVTRLKKVGTILAIHRFPVKSMQGECLTRVGVGERGVDGDRAWALRDLEVGEITSAKHFPRILQFRVRQDPDNDGLQILFPNGEQFPITSPDISARISSALKHRVELVESSGKPPAHFRLRAFRSPAVLRRLLGARRGGPTPDLSQLPLSMLATLSWYASPPGTYFDAFPLHLVTSNALSALGSLSGVPADARRFRPNFVIEADDATLAAPENEWVGRRMLVGAAEIEICSLTFRCGMPSHAQTPDLPKAPAIVKTIYGALDTKFGVYARVLRPGLVRVGDRVLSAEVSDTPALRQLREVGRALKRAILDAYLTF